MNNEKFKRVKELIADGTRILTEAGLDTPRLDAELLLAHALNTPRVLTPLPLAGEGAYYSYLHRRRTHEPIAYITRTKAFWTLDFTVTPDVLIPRPDTELLIEHALKSRPKTIADICTGSGCIAITLAKELPSAKIWATDICEKALQVAKENATRHDVTDQITFLQGDLLGPIDPSQRFDLIAANPPYILPKIIETLDCDVRDFEPHLALAGEGSDGLGHHRRILEQSISLLASGGQILLEIGFDQSDAIRQIVLPGLTPAEIISDYGGNPRLAIFSKVVV